MRPTLRDRNNRKFFDTFEYERLIKLIESDIYAAKEGFEDYLIRYKDDMSAHVRYASILITLGEFDKVDKILQMIEYRLAKSSIYKEDEYKGNSIRRALLFNRARLYAFQNKTWDSLHIIFNNPDVFETIDKHNIFYLRNLVNNHIDKSDRDRNNSYIYRQIINYKEEDFIDHIKKHKADFNENDRTVSPSFFSYDTPIEKLIDGVKNNLNKENALNTGFISNTYLFKYDACGRSDNKITDYFEVVTFNGTNKIITMYPTKTPNNRKFVDLNYLKEKEEETSKVKVISQIDKFNRRYNNGIKSS